MEFNLAYEQPVQAQSIERFESCDGAKIFQLPLEAFPGFWAYAYLVLIGEFQVLIDTGSGFGVCNDHLTARLQDVDDSVAERVGLTHLTHVLITHGHIDHFGGLSYLRKISLAKIGVHKLDVQNLTNTEERLNIIAQRLNIFLIEAGVLDDERTHLIQLYKMIKLDYEPVPVDFSYDCVGMELGPFDFLHVPGHSAGQVVIRLHDVLFSGDHILSEISPHQAPERLVPNTGLRHYLQSLDSLQNWAADIRLTLGGHNPPVTDLFRRIDEIREVHHLRLEKIISILDREPLTIGEIAEKLFGEVHGYNVLLALEETGAHIEYLTRRGQLAAANLSELGENSLVPIRYQTLKQLSVNVKN